MTDLWLGMALMILLGGAAFAGGLWVAKKFSTRVTTLMILLTVVTLLLYARFVYGRPMIARWLPFSNVIMVGNALPVLAGFLAGLAWGRIHGRAWRKCVTVVPLAALGIYSLARPLVGEPPACATKWKDGVCLQTSPATCSAAAAVTLLRHYGIESTEQEMAVLSLTREKGTLPLGLFRGLKRKTAGTAWDVEMVIGDISTSLSASLDALRATAVEPVIITVGLRQDAQVDRRYEEVWNWTRGVEHTVVLFRFLPDDKVEMGDPSFGRERWDVQGIRDLWHRDGIRLVKRKE